jgi:hypothetical protein
MRFALHVVACVLSLALAGALRAQPLMQPYFPGFAGLPPHEVLALVRSAGFDPVSRPVRQGPVYVLRALSPADQEVRVVVDARMGRIVKVAAVDPADPGAFAPPAAIPQGRMVPGSNAPGSTTLSAPPRAHAAPTIDDARPGLSDPPPKPSVRANAKPAPAPVPRPRPKEVTAAEPQPSTATTHTGSTANTGTTTNAGPTTSPGSKNGPSTNTGPSASAGHTAPWATDIDE